MGISSFSYKWFNRREDTKEIEICSYVVCDDGTAWGLGDDGEWHEMSPIPGTPAAERSEE